MVLISQYKWNSRNCNRLVHLMTTCHLSVRNSLEFCHYRVPQIRFLWLHPLPRKVSDRYNPVIEGSSYLYLYSHKLKQDVHCKLKTNNFRSCFSLSHLSALNNSIYYVRSRVSVTWNFLEGSSFPIIIPSTTKSRVIESLHCITIQPFVSTLGLLLWGQALVSYFEVREIWSKISDGKIYM